MFLWALAGWAQAQQATLSSMQGTVELQPQGTAIWAKIPQPPAQLRDGDQVRTGARSKCGISFPDGSRIELKENASFALGKVDASQSAMEMKLGTMKAWVQKAAAREFKVKTPSAVCAVRGTEFSVDVRQDGTTAVELYKGLLGVTDNRGNELLLQPGQRLEVDPRQMGAPTNIQEHRESKNEGERQEIRKEVGLEMTKDEILAAAAQELKLAEYQQGKSLIDVHGDRVRLESYILRPQPDQFKLVVLNEREKRFDYFYYLGTFNTALPTDLSVALRSLPGCVDATCPYYLTGFERGMSNLTDSLKEIALDGHQVNVNGNSSAADNVTLLFDAAQDAYVDVTGRPVFQTIYDRYGLYANGILKEGWIGTNLTGYFDGGRNRAPTADPITGTALGASLIPPTLTSRSPDPTSVHQEVRLAYNDGSFIKYDNYIIDDEGQIAPWSAFGGVGVSPTAFRSVLLNWNYEQVITATEFGDRSIDLTVAPKILIEAGLIQ